MAVQRVQALKEEPTRVTGKWASTIATLCAHNAGKNVFTVGMARSTHPAGLPTCASGGTDRRGALSWDTSHTVANCKGLCIFWGCALLLGIFGVVHLCCAFLGLCNVGVVHYDGSDLAVAIPPGWG